MDWNTLGGSFGMGGGGLPPPSQGIGYGQRPAMPGPPPGAPGLGGTTRRGSQILDAQGNVIGHYDDNNQPVYHVGQGGGGMLGWNGGITGRGQDPRMSPMGGTPQGPVASTSMGMAPSYARMGVPGSMQQALYGNGLLRPAMPSMNNQSGY